MTPLTLDWCSNWSPNVSNVTKIEQYQVDQACDRTVQRECEIIFTHWLSSNRGRDENLIQRSDSPLSKENLNKIINVFVTLYNHYVVWDELMSPVIKTKCGSVKYFM